MKTSFANRTDSDMRVADMAVAATFIEAILQSKFPQEFVLQSITNDQFPSANEAQVVFVASPTVDWKLVSQVLHHYLLSQEAIISTQNNLSTGTIHNNTSFASTVPVSHGGAQVQRTDELIEVSIRDIICNVANGELVLKYAINSAASGEATVTLDELNSFSATTNESQSHTHSSTTSSSDTCHEIKGDIRTTSATSATVSFDTTSQYFDLDSIICKSPILQMFRFADNGL